MAGQESSSERINSQNPNVRHVLQNLGAALDRITTPSDANLSSDGPQISRTQLTRDPLRDAGRHVGRFLSDLTEEPPAQEGSPNTPRMTRREMGRGIVSNITSAGGPLLDAPLGVLADLCERVSQEEFNRRKMLIGMAVVGTLAIIGRDLWNLYQENPHFFQQSEAAAKLFPVWQELQDLGKDYTNEELTAMTHNPFKKIQLTAEETANTLFVGNGDSIYLKGGIRHNSLGVQQPQSWLEFAAQNVSEGLQLLGIDSNVTYANYAQPGAASNEVVGPQKFGPDQYGNVQLGARTVDQMRADNATSPELPPYDLMINHQGPLIASYGIHGDDMRDTATLAIQYLNPKSEQYDAAFAVFVKSPSQNGLTPHIADVLLTLIDSYKKDRQRIKDNFAKALEIYREINKIRVARRMGKMYLVVTQPMRLDEAKNAPFTPPDAERGTRGTVNVSQLGEGGQLAGRMVMLPFYQEEAPLLSEFERQTRDEDGTEVQVTSVPLLALSGQDNLVIWDGHYNELGEEGIWAEVAKALEVRQSQQQRILTFGSAGVPHVAA